jgi:hypothetical protein
MREESVDTYPTNLFAVVDGLRGLSSDEGYYGKGWQHYPSYLYLPVFAISAFFSL